MRILVVSAWAPWRIEDGDGLVVHNQLRLLESRHELRVIVAQPPRSAADLAHTGLADTSILTTFEPTPSSTLDFARRRIAASRIHEPVHVPWVMRPELVQAAGQQLAQHRPDVVHLIGWGTAPMWQLTGSTPTTHMAIDPWMQGRRNRILSVPRRALELGQQRAVVRHEHRHYPMLDAVGLVSSADVEDMSRLIPDARFVAIPNGVDAGIEPEPPTADPVLVFHGAFSVLANISAARTLVEDVLPAVQSRVPDARVLLVGRDAGPAVRSLEGPHVEVTGAVADIRRALQRGAVSVAPMTVGSGMKNKILEAMAAGLPVVTTSAGSRGIGEGDGVIVRDDWASMAAAVTALLDNPDERIATGVRGRDRVVREFSWQRSVERLEELWGELARG